jgi:hypothetical protein
MTDLELMQQIRAKWGTQLAQVARRSSVPDFFFAALVANESGGDPSASRFEPEVLLHLIQVLLGERASYGSIGRNELLITIRMSMYTSTSQLGGMPGAGGSLADAAILALRRLKDLATSWGMTQIMGWHTLDYGTKLDWLKDPLGNLEFAAKLLYSFAESYGLDVRKEFESLFRCWNTGQPNGKTFDPEYVPRGLERMKLYEQIAAAPAPPQPPAEEKQ